MHRCTHVCMARGVTTGMASERITESGDGRPLGRVVVGSVINSICLRTYIKSVHQV